ncbi:MAG: FG-GAP-like repeat-containing protein [Planctomycetota bacterium]|nr:FG-GAP-like repeat-containing protein [Planctomycetota bacterium]
MVRPPVFARHVIRLRTGEGDFSVFAGDIDGDGDTDVVYRGGDPRSSNVFWYENDGASPPAFTERVVSNNRVFSTFLSGSVVAADVDGDGDTDVPSADQVETKWYENDGASPPAFTEQVISRAGAGAVPVADVAAADVDGDGDTDVLVATFVDNRIVWYENVSAPPDRCEGLVQTAGLILFGWSLEFIGDVDGDSIADYAVGALGGGFFGRDGVGVSIFSGGSRRLLHSFGTAADNPRPPPGFGQRLAGREGRLAVESNPGGNRFRIHVYQVSADRAVLQFVLDLDLRWRIPLVDPPISWISDLDGDNFADLLVTQNNGFGIYSGRTSEIIDVVDVGGVDPPTALSAIGDVDADGIEDFAVGCHRCGSRFGGPGAVYIYSGANRQVIQTFFGESIHDFFGFAVAPAGDLTGDGVSEVIVGAPAYLGNPEDFLGGENRGRTYVFDVTTGDRLPRYTRIGESRCSGYGLRIVGSTGSDQTPRVGWVTSAPGFGDSRKCDLPRPKLYFFRDGEIVRSVTAPVEATRAFGFALAQNVHADGSQTVLVGDSSAIHSGGRGNVYSYHLGPACTRGLVDLSVKVILDADGQRPMTGHYTTDSQIKLAFVQANEVLAQNDARWRLHLSEIVEVAGAAEFFDIAGVVDARRLEMLAEANHDQGNPYKWRNDAINIYIANSLPWGGTCSFPGMEREMILINNSEGILNAGAGWLHEIGHFLGLTHTFRFSDEDPPPCDATLGAAHGGNRGNVSCPDLCPDAHNVMSYNVFSVAEAELTQCQLDEMAFELFDIQATDEDLSFGSRNHVLIESLTPPDTHPVPPPPELVPFIRGDSNGDGGVDISDMVFTLLELFAGGSASTCPDAADTNDDGDLNVTDPIFGLHYLFLDGDLPRPGANFCSGDDDTSDDLSNCQYDTVTLCPGQTATDDA